MSELVISGEVLEGMLEHARGEHPRECVGLLFGRGRRARRRVALPNVAASPETTFYAEPGALLRVLREADAQGEEHLGIYHSHPRGPETPSPTDLAQAYYGVAQLIVIPQAGSCRAFLIEEGRYREISLTIDASLAPDTRHPSGENV